MIGSHRRGSVIFLGTPGSSQDDLQTVGVQFQSGALVDLVPPRRQRRQTGLVQGRLLLDDVIGHAPMRHGHLV